MDNKIRVLMGFVVYEQQNYEKTRQKCLKTCKRPCLILTN